LFSLPGTLTEVDVSISGGMAGRLDLPGVTSLSGRVTVYADSPIGEASASFAFGPIPFAPPYYSISFADSGPLSYPGDLAMFHGAGNLALQISAAPSLNPTLIRVEEMVTYVYDPPSSGRNFGLVSPQGVPEPSSLVTALIGLVTIAIMRKFSRITS
jgi:hypothetical protein